MRATSEASGTVLLIADGNTVARAAARLPLSEAGFTVIEPATADEVVAAAAAEQPHAILLELALPGDSFQAIRAIVRRNARARIVVLTRSNDLRDFYRAMEAGAIGYLVKARDDQCLVSAVQAAVRGEAVIPRRLTKPLVDGLFPPSSRLRA